MVFEWLAREGWMLISWWMLVTLAGAAALPLCVRLLSGLPDRGYTLARAVGLLLVGYIYWLLASLGFLRNSAGAMVLAWLIVLVLALLVYARGGMRWRSWWRDHRAAVISAEILFAVLLVAWAVVRAHQPELRTTEKPMDLMFISSIMRSDTFPPNDAWMSGYAISYYYFGYLLAAMLSMLSGVVSTTGYNLMNALLFALTGLTVFGVTYNLVRARTLRLTLSDENTPEPDMPRPDTPPVEAAPPAPRAALLVGLLAVVLVNLMGNFQTALVELPYQSRIASESYLRFWGTQERDIYPERAQARRAGIADDIPVTLLPGQPDPAQWDYWWWFRASRVLTDFNLDGTISTAAQPIDEFPQFSFLLSDNHPHVMALPFAALMLGLALNLLLTSRDPSRDEMIFYGLSVGALVFLNTWDGPIYMLALTGADGLRRLMRRGRLRASDWWMLFNFLLTLLILTVVFYLPFLLGFRSQASGLLPNLIHPTFLPHFFLMFGPFLLILAPFLWLEARRGGSLMNWRLGLQAAGALLAALVAVLLGLVLLALFIPDLYAVALRFVETNGGMTTAFGAVLRRRLEALPTLLLLLAGVVVVVARAYPRRIIFEAHDDDAVTAPYTPPVPYPTAFALLLILLGLGLVLVPEFFYLRDNFGTRINTIFKFYYQAWLVFALASAYAVYALFGDRVFKPLPGLLRALTGVVAAAGIAAGLIYPVLAIQSRMFVETGRLSALEARPLSLDGGGSFTTLSDFNAIQCLKGLVAGDDVVVVEAVGASYNPAYGRVGSLTGVPILLGWENHQRQWRGADYPQIAGTRAQDIAALYNDLRWDAAQPILQRYGIDYVFYGSTERAAYGSTGEEKFREYLEPVCQSEGSLFYRVTDAALQKAGAEPSAR